MSSCAIQVTVITEDKQSQLGDLSRHEKTNYVYIGTTKAQTSLCVNAVSESESEYFTRETPK